MFIHFDLGSCQSTGQAWHCYSSQECIQRSSLCDGRYHCKDLSDESRACARFFNCIGNYFYDMRFYIAMSPVANSIPSILVCDGVPDCFNHADEINCKYY